MQHLNAKNTTLYCEDGAEFDRLLESLRAEHSPVGSTEDFLVQQMTASFWKARRLGRAEIGMIDYQTDVAERSFIPCPDVLKRLPARRTGQRAPK